MNKNVISIIIAFVLIGGAFLVLRSSGQDSQVSPNIPTPNNVSIVNGVQVIEITAKGGYLPRKSVAKAGIPTVLRFKTAGTFDCSSSVRIPSKDISKMLPQTGDTDIEIGTSEVALLQGTCGMGMYPFEVDFQS